MGGATTWFTIDDDTIGECRLLKSRESTEGICSIEVSVEQAGIRFCCFPVVIYSKAIIATSSSENTKIEPWKCSGGIEICSSLKVLDRLLFTPNLD